MKILAIIILLGLDAYFINHSDSIVLGKNKTLTVHQFLLKSLFQLGLLTIFVVLVTDLTFSNKDVIIYAAVIIFFMVERSIAWIVFKNRQLSKANKL